MSNIESITFANRFYEKLKLEEYDGIIKMEKQKFFELLKEEIEVYSQDTQAEVGIGIYQIICDRRRILSDSDVLDNILNVCRDLINKSPECALEFSKNLGVL